MARPCSGVKPAPLEPEAPLDAMLLEVCVGVGAGVGAGGGKCREAKVLRKQGQILHSIMKNVLSAAPWGKRG
jgi:hypothetical protein